MIYIKFTWIKVKSFVKTELNSLDFWSGEYSKEDTLDIHFGEYINQLGTYDNNKMMISSVSIWNKVQTLVQTKWNLKNFRSGEYFNWDC